MKIKQYSYILATGVMIALLFGPISVNAMEKMEDSHGMLTGAKGHSAKGKVALVRAMDGAATLILSNIEVDKVPDGYVYLAKDGDHVHGLSLGMLKQFSGTVQFKVPAGIDAAADNSVVIWCEKYSVEIGRAYLSKKMMMK